MGIADADTAEHNVPAATHLIVPVSCPVPPRTAGDPKLSGENDVRILPGTLLASIAGAEVLSERFFCNYEVNEQFRSQFESAGLKVSAVGPQGETRAVELPGHPFFLATLFQPQLTSKTTGKAHVVIQAYLRAVAGCILSGALNAKMGSPG